jgi:hypothetical protein
MRVDVQNDQVRHAQVSALVVDSADPEAGAVMPKSSLRERPGLARRNQFSPLLVAATRWKRAPTVENSARPRSG